VFGFILFYLVLTIQQKFSEAPFGQQRVPHNFLKISRVNESILSSTKLTVTPRLADLHSFEFEIKIPYILLPQSGQLSWMRLRHVTERTTTCCLLNQLSAMYHGHSKTADELVQTTTHASEVRHQLFIPFYYNQLGKARGSFESIFFRCLP